MEKSLNNLGWGKHPTVNIKVIEDSTWWQPQITQKTNHFSMESLVYDLNNK